ncbi:hypothetical protein [Lactobacillus selangorensis]|uniref:hypothetical protein n=1 Tax=Lactobacillus selangorensis TaxID=81857 RepID=UPI00070E78C6|nr:hypothetical protein [Lactobacillus selangorensis]
MRENEDRWETICFPISFIKYETEKALLVGVPHSRKSFWLPKWFVKSRIDSNLKRVEICKDWFYHTSYDHKKGKISGEVIIEMFSNLGKPLKAEYTESHFHIPKKVHVSRVAKVDKSLLKE